MKVDFAYKIFNLFNRNKHIFALFIIFLLAFYIRSINIVPDRILSFDPVYQYRFTKYFVQWGFLPAWDELSYYVGRAYYMPPLMYYLTGVLYWIWSAITPGITLKTVAAWASALYGALIVIPAYLLARELSNRWGGILSAALIGFAPQILSRTFGSSYDTDQLVLFFILLTLWAGIRMLRKPNFFNFILSLFAFTGFMLTWTMFWYTYVILNILWILYVIGDYFLKNIDKQKIKFQFTSLLLLFISLVILGKFLKVNAFSSFLGLFQFALKPEVWIVNVSIAELQRIGYSLSSLILSFGKYITGNNIFDILFFLLLLSLIPIGLFSSWKSGKSHRTFEITLLALIGLITITRGIRFTEYSSAILLTLSAAGFGCVIPFIKKSKFISKIWTSLFILIIFVAFSTGLQVGNYLGPDINANWDNTWNFLKTQTPKLALVGTWWDPGHMITGYAERRVIADGAHCDYSCMYTINHRITDLGKIFTTTSEEEALKLLRKYQGTSPQVYWIASADLIGKFQWLQYFGTGCDARTEWNKCPLYIMRQQQNAFYTNTGDVFMIDYGDIKILNMEIPIVFYTRGKNAALFKEVLFYRNGSINSVNFENMNKTQLLDSLTPVFKNLGFRLSSQILDSSVWISDGYAYVVVIPSNLRNNLFTKMFFLEGQDLENFKLVFRNPEVKIYRVIGLENVTSVRM